MTKDYITNKIIELRESLGWSQAHLARQTKLTNSAISQIEKGDRTPSLETLRKLALVFDISMSELTGDIISSRDDAMIFFRKWKDILKLNESDQAIVLSCIRRFKRD